MSFRIWQFSDTHLFADEQAKLYDLNTAETLSAVLDHARHADNQASLAVVTGDLVQDESEQGYQCFERQLSSLKIPVYCIPGNHDDPEILTRTLQGGEVQVLKSVIYQQWQLLFLDTTVLGKVGGRLDRQQADQLRQCLMRYPNMPTIVFMHHPPLPTGMQWLDDGQILEQPEELFLVLDQFPQMRGVCWGHAHQAHESSRHLVKLLGCPSTMVQFKPDCQQFTLDTLAPAYRWLDCHADGRLDSGVIYV